MSLEFDATGDLRFAHVRRSPYVVSARKGDDTVLMDVARGIYFSLDDVGGRAWDLLSTTTDAVTIAARLAEEYDAPKERIEKDVIELLSRLDAAHLLWTD